MDTPKTKPASLHSTTSSATVTPTTQEQEPQPNDPAPTNTTKNIKNPAQYFYTERKGPPNPDAQPKKKSRMSKFVASFQSPAVQQANAARERVKLEEERMGVRRLTPSGAPGGAGQATGAFL